jgi:hypothetical protein
MAEGIPGRTHEKVGQTVAAEGRSFELPPQPTTSAIEREVPLTNLQAAAVTTHAPSPDTRAADHHGSGGGHGHGGMISGTFGNIWGIFNVLLKIGWHGLTHLGGMWTGGGGGGKKSGGHSDSHGGGGHH